VRSHDAALPGCTLLEARGRANAAKARRRRTPARCGRAPTRALLLVRDGGAGRRRLRRRVQWPFDSARHAGRTGRRCAGRPLCSSSRAPGARRGPTHAKHAQGRGGRGNARGAGGRAKSLVGLFKALAQGSRGPGQFSPAVLGDPAASLESPERKRFDHLRLVAKNASLRARSVVESDREYRREECEEWKEERDGPYPGDVDSGARSNVLDCANAAKILEVVESYGRSRGWTPPSPKPKRMTRKSTAGKVPRKQLATKAARKTRPSSSLGQTDSHTEAAARLGPPG